MSYLLPMVTVANHQASNLRNLPAATTDGVSVAHLLAAPSLADSDGAGRRSGLDRMVRGVSVLDAARRPAVGEAGRAAAEHRRGAGPTADRRPGSADLLALIADLDARQVPALALRLGAGRSCRRR